MSVPVLVAFATRYGSTQEAAEAVAATLRENGLEVSVQPLKQVRTLEGYGAVVLGAALYMGHWYNDADRFLTGQREALTGRPVAVFALGPIQSPANEQELQGARAQLDKELAKHPWLSPVAREVFGGKYDPAKLRFPDNLVAILDYNKFQETGPISREMALEPLVQKWHAFGWNVVEADGHSIPDLLDAFEKVRQVKGQPSIIIAHTIKGKGVSFVETDFTWHGRALSPELAAKAREEILCN